MINYNLHHALLYIIFSFLQPEIHIENEYFGMGIPDYASIGRRTQPWALSKYALNV